MEFGKELHKANWISTICLGWRIFTTSLCRGFSWESLHKPSDCIQFSHSQVLHVYFLVIFLPECFLVCDPGGLVKLSFCKTFSLQPAGMMLLRPTLGEKEGRSFTVRAGDLETKVLYSCCKAVQLKQVGRRCRLLSGLLLG